MFCVLIFLLWKPFVPTVTESWFVIFIVRTFSKTIYGSFVLNFCIYKKQKLKKGKRENRWRCLSVTSSGDSVETHVSNPSVFLTNELSQQNILNLFSPPNRSKLHRAKQSPCCRLHGNGAAGVGSSHWGESKQSRFTFFLLNFALVHQAPC